MALESGTYISDLVTTNPVHATDQVSQGDDHLRLIKAVLKNSFPNVNGAVNPSVAEFNALVGLATELGLLAGLTAAAAELNILDGALLSTAELNVLNGILASTAELNLLNGVTASTAELNKLAGLGTLSGSNTGDEVAASTTVAGVVEKATAAELTAGATDKFPDAAGVKAYVGVGNTWQDMSASRAANTAYQNTTGGPIKVSFALQIGATGRDFSVSADDITYIAVARLPNASTIVQFGEFTIPDQYYYKITGSITGITTWSEFRP